MEMEKKVMQLSLDDVLPNRFQPRIKFNEKSINELAESIKKYGVIQPIVVRQIADKYEIIAGERRYKASVIAGKETIPAILANLDDRDSAEVALIENVQREDLTPIEEAVSYKKILDMGYLTQAQLAQKLGKEQSTIANKLRLLNLQEDVQESLLDQEISERHARSLLRLTDPTNQKDVLNRIVSERLTVRKTDEIIDQLLNKNNNVEILDFTNPSTSIKEETMSNQENTFQFNVPTEAIIEEVEATTNPGFVNVDKIEVQAQDIFKEQPKVDMNSLLQPMNSNVPFINPVEIKPEVIENNDDMPLKPRKYFNLMSDDENTPVSQPFVSIFGDLEAKPVETVEMEPVAPVAETSMEPLESKFDFDSFFKIDPIPVIQPTVVTPTIEEVMPIAQPVVFNPPVEEVAIVEEPTPMEEPLVIEQKGNNAFVVGDLKTVINTIRTCASTIEKYGYIIDTEEFDFEDMYQVIFKVSKK